MTKVPVSYQPLSIAHRGASAYAPGNTMEAFKKAALLGADIWETDIRLTSDGVAVTFHDDTLADGSLVSSVSREDLRALSPECPDFAQVVALAKENGVGIYADIKDKEATINAYELLVEANISPVIIGAFDPKITLLLKKVGSVYPVSRLVPIGVDPFEYASDADVIHLCWEDMDRPQDSLTRAFFERVFRAGKCVVIWHEEDPTRMAALRTKPVAAICSDRPELVKQFHPPAEYPFGIVCHRGTNSVAPENTLPAFECALAGGFSHIEVDLHKALDGEIVVIHDDSVDRTTNGRGIVSNKSINELRQLDAGSWFSAHFRNAKLPTLAEVLDLLHRYNGSAYLELKSAPPEPVLRKVLEAGLIDRVFFWSFNRDFLIKLRDISDNAVIMARRMDYHSLSDAIEDFKADIIEFRPSDDPLEITSLRGSRVKTMIAYNGEENGVFDQILDMRPDFFNLDKPYEFAKFSREKFRNGQIDQTQANIF